MDRSVGSVFIWISRTPVRPAHKFLLNAIIRSRMCKFVRHANAIVDSAIIRRPMPDDANAAHAKKLSPAVFTIVQPPPKIVESLP